MKKNYLILFLTFLCNICFAQSEIVNSKINEIIQKYQAIGLSVAVVKDNQIIFNQSYGFKNKETNEVLKNDDLFRIASISKSFSATAIMQLIEQKKCNLEDDFSDLIGFPIRNPNFPNKKITLKMVLSHTSSINDKNGYFDLDVINPNKSEKSTISYNNYEPGTKYEYCNLNFNMIGAVIERLSKERFDNHIKKHILQPLNLYAGYCVDSLDQSKFVTLYEYNTTTNSYKPQPSAYNPRSQEIKNYTLGYSTPIFSPTGGMKISALDLAKYMKMHMNYGQVDGKKIISKKSSKIMQTPLSDTENYGLALKKTNKLIPNKTLVGHTGSAYGLYSLMFFDPKEKFGIVAITNGCATGDYTDFNPFLKEIFNTLNNELIAGK